MFNLKERLEHIQLSDAQKARIKTNIKKTTKKSRSFVPIVIPAIVMLSVFFLMLSVWPSNDSTTMLEDHQVSANELNISKIHLSIPVILWSIANSVLVLLTYIMFKRSLQSVTRWQHDERMQEWNAFMYRPVLPKLLLLISICLLWIGAILFSNTLWFVQTCFTILLITFITIWENYTLRERQWSKCPHCGEKMTRKQILRKSFVPFRERCDHCNELIYVNPKENQNILFFYIVPLNSMALQTLFNLHLLLVLLFAIGSVVSLYYFVLAYMVTFSDTEEKPW